MHRSSVNAIRIKVLVLSKHFSPESSKILFIFQILIIESNKSNINLNLQKLIKALTLGRDSSEIITLRKISLVGSDMNANVIEGTSRTIKN